MNFDFFKKNLVYILALILVVIIGYQYYNSHDQYENELLAYDTSDDKSFSQSENKSDIQIETKEDEIEELYVHISGAVKNPGLYKMKPNSRIADAIEEAGGSLDDANLDAINLAAKLSDEDKIYLPKIGEEVPSIATSTSTSSTNAEKINLNTADLNSLTNIPGVGEKTAQKILEYREKNRFKNIEDIKNVDGIGDKKFESMKDFITT
ncbi:DUF655 domain-containing protein [Peptoniphilus sp.]|jgi:competence protein ComEA|uniref:DUF655 domain-containing protein n=1 Tax=Peptoniphilus sp. TaxID=1971214 RepID=UPI003D8A2B57